MTSWDEIVDRDFAGSDDEIEAYRDWLSGVADDELVKRSMQCIMPVWMASECHEQARLRFARGMEDERNQ